MKVKDYKELIVWNKGIEIADMVYSLTTEFPKSERYVLNFQMQKAAVSIASNIAEGFVRQHTKEYRQFLYIALGSCAELETQLFIAYKRGYLKTDSTASLREALNHECRMLMSIIRKISSHETQATSHSLTTND